MSGMTAVEARRYFADALPTGSNVYVGLFTSLPNGAGEGGVECSEAWYSRVAHAAWVSTLVGAKTIRRSNVGDVQMAAVGGGDPDVTVVGWGIWDASSGGNLRWFGPLLDAAGNETPVTLTAGDQLRWPSLELRAQLNPADDQTESMLMETVSPATNTTDATETYQNLLSLADEEAIHIEAEIIARHTTGGGTDYHYYRKVRVSFYRDSTTSQWGSVRQQTTDGAQTRINLTTATAEIEASGNTIRAAYTGEAGKNLTWHTVWRQLSDADPS